MRLKTTGLLSEATRTALVQLGARLKLARQRRREPLHLVAERLATTAATLRRLERGDPSLSVALYVAAMALFGFESQLFDLADPEQDVLGKRLDAQRQPQRVRRPKLDNEF
jgi:transcriptional regulator with XRE-family HTH domain